MKTLELYGTQGKLIKWALWIDDTKVIEGLDYYHDLESLVDREGIRLVTSTDSWCNRSADKLNNYISKK